MMRALQCVGLSLLLMSCQTRSPVMTQRDQLQQVGNLEAKAITEASGMAASQIHPDRLWVINDSGNDPVLYAIGLDGSDAGRVTVGGVENRDWEDLASYRKDGRSWLVVGEIGDNDAKYSICRLLFVEEPFERGQAMPEVINPARILEFRYEDGPRDAEGLSIDPVANKIYLLSKRTEPPVLYELPLEFEEQKLQTVIRVGEVNGIQPPSLAVQMAAPVKGKFSSMPTAMDRHPGTGWNVIMTYRDLYLYSDHALQNGEGPAGMESLPHLRQGESVCFSEDGSALYFTSEKRPSPLYRLELPSGMKPGGFGETRPTSSYQR